MKYHDLTLGQVEAVVNKLGGPDGVKRFLRGEPMVLGVQFLKTLQTGINAQGIDLFVTREKFCEGKEVDGVAIGFLGTRFKEQFLGKIEDGVTDLLLTASELTEDLRNPAIITALGGDDRAEVSLAHVWALLKRQGHGEDGVLLISECTNIFYVRDVVGTLWALGVQWISDDRIWAVEASSIEHPPRRVGCRIFSRDS